MNSLVQKATPHLPGGPGRPPAYEHARVVDDAVALFWRSGYDDTSLADLEDGLGVNRSTLYASFGGKAGLYEAAVDSYVATMETNLVTPMIDGTEGVADLVAFVDRLRAIILDPANPDGCLIINAMGSADPPAAMDRYLATLRTAFAAALRRAAEMGEIDPSTSDDKASVLLASAIGVNLAAKSGMSAVELVRLVDGVRAVIAGWAEPD